MDWKEYPPTIIDPYPPFTVDEVTEFTYDQDLYIARKKDSLSPTLKREGQWVVYTDYACSMTIRDASDHDHKTRWTITVPAGFVYDLTSVPSVLRAFAGRVGKHLEAATMHDYLYIAWQNFGARRPFEKDWVFSNLMMNAAMKKAGVTDWRRWGIMMAVQSPISRNRYFRTDVRPHFVSVPDPAQPSFKGPPPAAPLAEGALTS